eukprot:scaffold471_cov372-Pavlova_lutheri.AAC.4
MPLLEPSNGWVTSDLERRVASQAPPRPRRQLPPCRRSSRARDRIPNNRVVQKRLDVQGLLTYYTLEVITSPKPGVVRYAICYTDGYEEKDKHQELKSIQGPSRTPVLGLGSVRNQPPP